MKKRINLFAKKKQEQPVPFLAIRLMSYGIYFVCFAAVLAIASGIVFYLLQQQANTLAVEVANLNNVLTSNAKVSSDIVFFVNKKVQLEDFLKDDVQFQKYYAILTRLARDSNSNAVIKSMSIDKSKETQFTITFSDFNKAEQLVKYIESAAFLANFDELSLDSFTVASNSLTFELRFLGKFKEIKNETTN